MSRTTRDDAASDLDLAQRAAAGDPESWRELVDTLGPRIFGIALQFAHERSRAEDLTQEVFLKLFRNLHKYRGDVSLRAWALRLSRNLCIDEYRRRRAERVADFVPPEVLESLPMPVDPAAVLERREVLAQARGVLREMDDNVALLIVLRDFHGLSYEEMAHLLAMAPGTVKSRLHRGRRQLLRTLRERWGEDEQSLSDRMLEPAAC